MAEVVWLDPPVDLGEGGDGSWADIDITSHVGADAGNVAVAIIRVDLPSSLALDGIPRANGSTDTLLPDPGMGRPGQGKQTEYYVPIDADDIFETHTDSVDTDENFHLVGYFLDGDADGPTNRLDKSLSVANWTDIDISSDTGTDTAIAAAGFMLNTDDKGNDESGGVRVNGSTDTWPYGDLDNVATSDGVYHGFCIGCDGSEIFEHRRESNDLDLYVTAYIIDANYTAKTNGVDYSTGTTGSYQTGDITSDTSGTTIGAVFGVINGTSDDDQFAIRNPDNSSWEVYGRIFEGISCFSISVDSGQQFEQKIEVTSLDCYLLGYFEADGGGGIPPAVVWYHHNYHNLRH